MSIVRSALPAVACVLAAAAGACKGSDRPPARPEAPAASEAPPAKPPSPAPPPEPKAPDAPPPKVADLPEYDAASLEALARDGTAKLTLVAVWATWCVPCIEEMPALSAVHEEKRSQGLRVLGLAMDDRSEMAEKMQAVLDRERPSYPMAVVKPGTQDAFMAAIDAKWDGSLPATILYDGTGRKIGFLREKLDRAALDRIVGPLLR